MIYTLEQIDQLTKESVRRENALIAEYRRTHTVPGRGVISTPEIDAVQSKSVCMGNTSKLLPIRINHHPPGRWFSFAHFLGEVYA
jgi:hypothetical protein